MPLKNDLIIDKSVIMKYNLIVGSFNMRCKLSENERTVKIPSKRPEFSFGAVDCAVLFCLYL